MEDGDKRFERASVRALTRAAAVAHSGVLATASDGQRPARLVILSLKASVRGDDEDDDDVEVVDDEVAAVDGVADEDVEDEGEEEVVVDVDEDEVIEDENDDENVKDDEA